MRQADVELETVGVLEDDPLRWPEAVFYASSAPSQKSLPFTRLVEMNPLLQDLQLSFRNVARQSRRSAMAIIAVTCGVIILLLAGGFIESNLHDMREATIASRLGHIQISRPGYFQMGQSEPFSYLLPQDSEDRMAIEQLPGIMLTGARISFGGLISHGESTISFIGEGVEPEKESLLSSYLFIPKGKGLSLTEPKGIIMGLGLAENLGVDVGDTVILMTSTQAGGINAVECRVRGLFSTVSKAYDDSALRLPISTARDLLRVSGSHVWVLLLEKTEDTQSVLASLHSRFPEKSLEFVPWIDLADFYNKTAVLLRKQFGVIESIIVIIILLSIANTLMMSVVERTGEVGTAMALGVTRAKIMFLFVLEGLLLGVGGCMVGLVLGSIAAYFISMIGIPMPPPPGMGHGFTAGILVTSGMLLNAAFLAVVTTLLASLYPAWRASRMVIVDALRFNR